jgi:hypothetical protein
VGLLNEDSIVEGGGGNGKGLLAPEHMSASRLGLPPVAVATGQRHPLNGCRARSVSARRRQGHGTGSTRLHPLKNGRRGCRDGSTGSTKPRRISQDHVVHSACLVPAQILAQMGQARVSGKSRIFTAADLIIPQFAFDYDLVRRSYMCGALFI